MANQSITKHTSNVDLFIDDTSMFYIHLVLTGFCLALICLLGLVANVVNLSIFLTLGLNDCVTISTFCLAVSDLGASSLGLCFSLSSLGVISVAPWTSAVDSFGLYVMFGWSRSMFVDISMLITFFISLEKTLCVMKPLQFKNMFTKKKSFLSCGFLCMFTVGSYLPIHISHELRWRFDETTNTTRLMLWLAPYRADVENYSNVFHNLILWSAVLLGITINASLMASKIKTAHAFRHRSKAGTPSDTNIKGEVVQLAPKDKRIVCMVYVIVVVCVALSVPTLLIVIMRRVVPSFNVIGPYANLFVTVVDLAFICSHLNSAVNIGIYYHFNTKFKNCLRYKFFQSRRESETEE